MGARKHTRSPACVLTGALLDLQDVVVPRVEVEGEELGQVSRPSQVSRERIAITGVFSKRSSSMLSFREKKALL